MRRFYFLIICAVSVVLSSHGANDGDYFQVEQIWYKVLSEEEGTAMVEYCDIYPAIDLLIIPNTVSYQGKNYRVKGISPRAFSQHESAIHIVISEGIETIGYYAFAYTYKVKTIVIPGSIKEIGPMAFRGKEPDVEAPPGTYLPSEIYVRSAEVLNASDNTPEKMFGETLNFATLYLPLGSGDPSNYTLGSGFAHYGEFSPYDVNGDKLINGGDVTALYSHLLDGKPVAYPVDVNGDGYFNATDITTLYSHLLDDE